MNYNQSGPAPKTSNRRSAPQRDGIPCYGMRNPHQINTYLNQTREAKMQNAERKDKIKKLMKKGLI